MSDASETITWQATIPGEHNCFDSASVLATDPTTCLENCPISPPRFRRGDRVTVDVAMMEEDFGTDWKEKIRTPDGGWSIEEEYMRLMTEEEVIEADERMMVEMAEEEIWTFWGFLRRLLFKH